MPLWLRSIDVLQKNDDSVDRAAYESVTRDARFWTYSEACGDDGVVLLGHNRDDTFENLFANINRRQHYDELRGMTPISEERGVTTWRPLLAIDKSSIYAAASTLELPHLADSTDPTCQRGVFRDSWLPVVRDQQPLLLPGLESLADHVAFLTEVWREKCRDYVATCERFGGGASLPVENWMTRGAFLLLGRRFEAAGRAAPAVEQSAGEPPELVKTAACGAARASTCELGRGHARRVRFRTARVRLAWTRLRLGPSLLDAGHLPLLPIWSRLSCVHAPAAPMNRRTRGVSPFPGSAHWSCTVTRSSLAQQQTPSTRTA